MYIDMKRPESCAKCPLLKRSWLRGERCALKGGPEACPLRDEMEPRLLAYSEAMAADVVWMERRGSLNLQVMMPTWIDGELCLMGVHGTSRASSVAAPRKYGERYRFWNGRPGREQRENTPWGGEASPAPAERGR